MLGFDVRRAVVADPPGVHDEPVAALVGEEHAALTVALTEVPRAAPVGRTR
jgi:hypothetical protein